MREWLDSTFKNEKRSKPPLVSKEIISNRSEIDYFNLPNGFKVYESETFTSCIDGLNIIDGSYIYRKDGLYFSKEDVKLSLSGLWFRQNDKINRLKQLVVLGQPDEVGESVEDTYQDLAVYSVIAQLVSRGKWAK